MAGEARFPGRLERLALGVEEQTRLHGRLTRSIGVFIKAQAVLKNISKKETHIRQHLKFFTHDIIDYLEVISDPEKVQLYKRWDKDKDYQTYGLSTHDYTALYERFNPRFTALDHDGRLRLSD